MATNNNVDIRVNCKEIQIGLPEKRETVLGKITFAEFGFGNDIPFMGLRLGFSWPKGEVSSGRKYTVNVAAGANWKCWNERNTAISEIIDYIRELLLDADAKYVSELINKPVEITFCNNRFKDFRILTEVL